MERLNELEESVSQLQSQVNDLQKQIAALEKRLEQSETKKSEFDKAIDDILLDIGIPTHTKGFAYTHTALEVMRAHATQEGTSITKIIYPETAKRLHTSYMSAERNIRNAINYAWRHRNNDVWEQRFGNLLNWREARPSNAKFLRAILRTLEDGHGM